MFKKISAIIAAVLIFLIIILLIAIKLAPGIAIFAAQHWYSEQGDGYQLSVGDWHFSPWQTELALDSVVLTHPKEGAGRTALAQLRIDLDPWALWHHKVWVRSVDISGLSLYAELKEQELKLAGLALPLNSEAKTEPVVSSNGPVPSWGFALGRIRLNQFDLSWQLERPELTTHGALELKTLRLDGLSSQTEEIKHILLEARLPKLSLASSQLELTEPLTIVVDGQVSGLLSAPHWQGRAQLQHAGLRWQDLELNFEELALKEMDVNSAEDMPFALAQLLLSELSLTQADQSLQLAQLQLEQLSGTLTEQVLAKLILSGLSLNTPEQLASLARYEAHDLALVQTPEQIKVNLGAHQFAGLEVKLKRDAQGQLEGLPKFKIAAANAESEAASETVPEPASQEAPAAKPKLVELVLTGLMQTLQEDETASQINIQDRSVKPQLRSQLVVQELNIGTAQAQLTPALSVAQPVPVHLALKVGEFGKLAVDANLGLYQNAEKLYPEGTIKLTARQLNIVDFNGYLIKAMGYRLERGTLDIDLQLTLHQAKMKGELKLLLRNSKFTPADEDTIKKFSKQIAMPVDMALDLLRDKHGNVVLTVPLSGHLDDPSFGFNDVLKQLTQKALKETALYLIKQSIQPYGTLLTLATYAGDYLFAIRLDALHYQNQQVELSEEQQAHLQKIAKLMKEKDSIEVQGCPFVNAEEAKALGDGWAELAKERGIKVKQWFETHSPEQANRFTLCRPQQGERAEVVLGVN